VDPKAIGKRMRTRREGKDMSLTAFAKKVGVSKATASEWELGRYRPSLDNLGRVAKVLDCEIGELLGAA
jgi:transcriptional regulator with XRE-family HTH domain